MIRKFTLFKNEEGKIGIELMPVHFAHKSVLDDDWQPLGGGFFYAKEGDNVAWFYGSSNDLGAVKQRDLEVALATSIEDFEFLAGKEVRLSQGSLLSSALEMPYRVLSVKIEKE